MQTNSQANYQQQQQPKVEYQDAKGNAIPRPQQQDGAIDIEEGDIPF